MNRVYRFEHFKMKPKSGLGRYPGQDDYDVHLTTRSTITKCLLNKLCWTFRVLVHIVSFLLCNLRFWCEIYKVYNLQTMFVWQRVNMKERHNFRMREHAFVNL